ncbi:MAG: DUF3179 domain-containing protein [candidate division Zixibacteria bacterium]|nr:DUF3179 domain-containing protein [candidate division Zixibacteria bacterium]
MKNYRLITAVSLIVIMIFAACMKAVVSERGNEGWLIPPGEVFEGGPGKDGIPALLTPPLATAREAIFLNDQSLVIGIKIGDVTRAYPHIILDWHEIINDEIGDELFSITYCPLTGSGIAWNRFLNGQENTFGVSGLLYNSNLIPYDRLTDSYWSQMKNLSVNGVLMGQTSETYPIVETTWETWEQMYPETRVVSTRTGYSRNYGVYPYGQYRTNDDNLLYPIANDDTRLPRKERIHGIIVEDRTKAYRIGSFSAEITAINDTFNGLLLVIAGSSSKNLVVSFKRQLANGTVLTFEPLQDQLPAIIIDNEGTSWDIFGNGISGPRTGENLEAAAAYNAYWFAWGAFYPETEIYGL